MRPGDTQAQFGATNWQLFLDLKASDPDRAHAALAELCRLYAPPLYAFARRKGHPPADAADLVQGLMVRLLERDAFQMYEPRPGALFRTWLISCLRRYELDEWRRGRAHKRGGHLDWVSLEETDDEGRPLHEVPDSATPEAAFDAAVARTITQRTFTRLRDELAEAGLAEVYRALAPLILSPETSGKMETYRELAMRLGMTVDAVSKRKERMAKRFGAILREEARRLVADDDQVDGELRHLLGALR